MEPHLAFDKQWYIECADMLELPYRPYNDVLMQLIELNGYVSLHELSIVYKVSRCIRGAGAACWSLHKLGYVYQDWEACKATHRNQPLIWAPNYNKIEADALGL